MHTLSIAFQDQHCHVLQFTTQQNKVNFHAKKIMGNYQDPQSLQTMISHILPWYTKKQRIIVGIPDHDILFQKITLENKLSDDEMMRWIQSRTQHLFGVAAKKLCLDYQIFSTNDQHVIAHIVAARRDFIISIEVAFSKAGIKITALDANSFALTRLRAATPIDIIIEAQNHRICLILLRDGRLHQVEIITESDQVASFLSDYTHPAILFITNNSETAQTIRQSLHHANVSFSECAWHSVLQTILHDKPYDKNILSVEFGAALGLALWGKHGQ